MKAYLKKKLMYLASFILIAVLIEFITFNVMKIGVFPQYFWLDLLLLLSIAMVIFLIPSFKAEAVCIVTILVLQATVSFVNQAMYKHPTMKNIFTIDMLNLVFAVGDVFSSDFVSMPFLVGLLVLIGAEICFLVYLKKYKTIKPHGKQFVSFILVVFMAMETLTGTIYTVAANSLKVPSDKDYYLLQDDQILYKDLSFTLKVKAFRKFGTYAFYFRNISKALGFSNNKNKATKLYEINQFLKQGKMSSQSGNYTPYTGVCEGNNLVMIMMESGEWFGVREKFTPTLYALMTQGVSAVNYISKNKTNQSEGISILGSYPTETVLSTELIEDSQKGKINCQFALPAVFQRSGYSTSYMHNNAANFYSRGSSHHALGFTNLYFLEQMPLLDGHNGKENFYNLDSDYKMMSTMSGEICPDSEESPFYTFVTTITMHGNYDNLVSYANAKDEPFWDYTSETTKTEKVAFRKQAPIPFLCDYYEYITKADFIAEFVDTGIVKAEDFTEEELHVLYLRYKQYQAAYMDLDRGIEALIKKLSDEGRLENTTFVMFGDHNAYYHELAFILKGYDINDNYHQSLYTVPFCIYDGSLPLKVNKDGREIVYSEGSTTPRFSVGKGNITKGYAKCTDKDEGMILERWTSPYDTVPTVLDLFGFSFNKNLYQGCSMFSDTPERERSLFVSMETGYCNDKFFCIDNDNYYYFASDGEIYVFNFETDSIQCGLIGQEKEYFDKDLEENREKKEDLETYFNQYENFQKKQAVYELIYADKFFNYKGYVGKNGIVYDYTDIDKLIVKL